MRNPQQPASSADPDSFLVLKISKRAALYLSLGLIAFGAAMVLRPAQNAPKPNDVVAAAASTSSPDPAAVARSAQSLPEPSPASVATPANDSSHPIDAVPSEPRSLPAAAPPPPPQPPPVTTITPQIVTYYPPEPATTAPDSSNSDSSSPTPPSDSNSSSTPSASADPPPAPPSPTNSPMIVNGAGSTSPHALYSKWFEAFHQQHSDVQFNYQSVGSGAGVKQLLYGTVSFAAVDAPLTDQQLKLAKIPVVHVPSVIGGVVLVYNLPGFRDLHLTPRILAGIFVGKITAWNDPQIAASNPSFSKLPAIPITVIHRSDGCASTQIFSDYLSKTSAEWQQKVGEGTSINWPLGLGAKGNEGVSALLQQYHGSITYMDFQYAVSNGMESAMLQNRSGHFVRADLRSLAIAAASSEIPDDFRVWITDAPGSDAYPIASFMWFLVPDSYPSDAQTRDFVEFLRWTTHNDPQMVAAKLGFAPLPKELLDRVYQATLRIH